MGLDIGISAEDARLRALRETGLLDTPPEQDFDDIVRLARRICEAPIALVSLVDEDRQWFKARSGITAAQTDLTRSVCAHAIQVRALTEIEDTRLDPRTRHNPLGEPGELGMRFYAGAPLLDDGGHALGTLCVIDYVPRRLTSEQRDGLGILARQVVAQIEMRRTHRAYVEALQIAEEHSAQLAHALEVEQTLKREIDHRVKNSLQLVGSLLQMQASRVQSGEVREALRTARNRVTAISTIHGALSRSSSLDRVSLSIYLTKLVEELSSAAPEAISVAVEADDVMLSTSQASSLAILINEFVTNSVKYAFPDGRKGTVSLILRSDGERISARFSDNGVGHSSAPGQAREGLGTRIMHAVGQQLGAELQFTADPTGTSLTFDFPIEG